MSRIFGSGSGTPVIDPDAVAAFFEARAARTPEIGDLAAVIYQDGNPELARRRDAVEKRMLGSRIAPFAGARVLDLGCGNGRWAADMLAAGCTYHGADASEGLVERARARFHGVPDARFTVMPVERATLAALDESEPFDRILCLGVLIYLNDEHLGDVAARLPSLARQQARIVLREPVGLGERLSIVDHFSEDMRQTYNAIYRTEAELLAALAPVLGEAGFRLTGSGDVYAEADLNNRVETRQRWFVFER